MPKCLLIEEDPIRTQFLNSSLENLGLGVSHATGKDAALDKIQSDTYELVVCSEGKNPAKSKFLIGTLRAESNVPVLMILDSSNENLVSDWMDAGADDYLTFPINQRLLANRVIQQLKRSTPAESERSTTLDFGPLRLEPQKHEFSVNGEPVALTSAEFQILQLLMQHPEQVFSREQILEALGIGYVEGSIQVVDAHASRIRKKIRAAGGPELLRAVRSVGFRLSPPKTKSII
jgi:DNA-binding response OmpR family regulator